MEGDKLYFLADLHAISMPHVPAELTANTRAMTAALVACGIDTDRSLLFNQARVPAHAELQWLLNGTARMGWLSRMTQFKDKSGKNREGASVALFTYPVLQAAHVALKAIMDFLRGHPDMDVRIVCHGEDTLHAYQVVWNMLYQDVRPHEE